MTRIDTTIADPGYTFETLPDCVHGIVSIGEHTFSVQCDDCLRVITGHPMVAAGSILFSNRCTTRPGSRLCCACRDAHARADDCDPCRDMVRRDMMPLENYAD